MLCRSAYIYIYICRDETMYCTAVHGSREIACTGACTAFEGTSTTRELITGIAVLPTHWVIRDRI